MFHPEVIALREQQIATRLGDELPGGKLLRMPVSECWAWRDHLASAVDSKGNLIRPLTPEESTFISHQQLISSIDFRYWATRYAFVAKEGQDTEPLTPLWGSQELFLSALAAREYDRVIAHPHPDGILCNILKARQLGISTLCEVILAHRATLQPSLRGLVAADVQEQAQYLFSMAELVIANLPWWLRPPVKAHQRGDFWESAMGSTVRVAWGKSSRGGLVERDSKAKGNIGRGKTFGLVHLSEFSTWERPEQIIDGLMPGIPIRARTFVAFESTAKGRYDAWHHHWLASAAGKTRFLNIFIPWYVEPDKYWLPAPDGWEPSPTTRQHIVEVEQSSPRYLQGRTMRLSREQAFYYEHTRASFEAQDALYKFREEYPATEEEAFQFAGRSIFGPTVLERLKSQERPPVAVLDIMPASDIAQLQQWEREAAAAAVAADAPPTGRGDG